MALCKIIYRPELFKLSSKWQEITPSKKGNIVTSEGKEIPKNFAGARYKVLCEAENTLVERIKRFVQGILRVIFTCGRAYAHSDKVKSLFTNRHRIYITPIVEQEAELEKVENPVGSEVIHPSKEKDKEKANRTVNDLGIQNLIQEKQTVLNQDIKTDQAEPVIHGADLYNVPEKHPILKQEPDVKPAAVASKVVTLEEAQEALEKGIEISTQTIERLKELMPKIAHRRKDDDLKFINMEQFFSTFTIPEEPDLIFKIAGHNQYFEDKLPRGGSNRTENRFSNTIKGKQVIMQYDLDLLRIPPTTIFKIESEGYEYAIIAEKRLAFKTGHYTQEDLYYKHADSLKNLIKQMVRFIKETGDDYIGYINYPILDPDGPEDETVRCGVINLEWVGNKPVDGFMGGKHDSPGLIGMMPTEELIDNVIDECKELGIELERESGYGWGIKDTADKEKRSQLYNIERYHKYNEFHEEKGIKTGNEPFMNLDDIDKLELDLEETWEYKRYINANGDFQLEPFTLRQAVSDVIHYINSALERKEEDSHLKIKRKIQLSLANEPFSIYQNLGLPPEKVTINYQEEQQLWLNRILKKLREKRYVFDYKKLGGMHGYLIEC